MKTRKTLSSGIFAVILVLIFTACLEDEPELPYSAGLEFKLINNGTAYSVSAGTARSNSYVVIPAFYNDLPVMEIDSIAFYECTELRDITIPASVLSIGDGAFFGCTALNNITIPASVKTIGNNAFGNCTGLTGITIPVSVTIIGSNAFSNCTRLNSITLAAGGLLTTIGNSAFEDCTNLTSITIPVNVTSIGSRTFDGCSRLTSVTFSTGSVSIGDYVFPEGDGYGGNNLKIAYLIGGIGTYMRGRVGNIYTRLVNGLWYDLITTGSNANTYRVRNGTVTSGAVLYPTPTTVCL